MQNDPLVMDAPSRKKFRYERYLRQTHSIHYSTILLKPPMRLKFLILIGRCLALAYVMARFSD